MWRDKKVSVIFPTYNEKESIRGSIEDFFSSGYVDEIIVVNNNAAYGTAEEVLQTRATQVFEARQGYGYAIQRGFEETTGELIIISEPDGTFSGHDVVKLLAYSDDFDVVFGTRTVTSLIGQGANMGMFLKWGNVAVAKLMEVLFLSHSQLTDVGCTMRLISRSALERIQHRFSIGGSHFGPEIMLLTIIHDLRYIEIPVNYRTRVGISSVTGSKAKAFSLGIRMIYLIISYRLKTLLGMI